MRDSLSHFIVRKDRVVAGALDERTQLAQVWTYRCSRHDAYVYTNFLHFHLPTFLQAFDSQTYAINYNLLELALVSSVCGLLERRFPLQRAPVLPAHTGEFLRNGLRPLALQRYVVLGHHLASFLGKRYR